MNGRPIPHIQPVMFFVDKIERTEMQTPPSEHWFLARINPGAPIPDIRGMSGGPIFGHRKLSDGRELYHVVAIQSTWRPDERIIYGCNFPVFAEMIFQAYLREFFPGHPDISPLLSDS